MKSTKWWIMASISFFVGMIVCLCGNIFKDSAIGVYFILLDCLFIITGWVLYAIGLVKYVRERRSS